MVKKINESWVDEDKRRKNRASLRKELEQRYGNRSHRYKKLVNKIKDNVNKHRITTQRSHNKKIIHEHPAATTRQRDSSWFSQGEIFLIVRFFSW